MATCTFDQLIYALRVSVEAANESLRHRREVHIAEGDARGEALHVNVPGDARADAALDAVVIPLRWFRDPRLPQVTEFSVAFDCQLRYERVRGRPGALTLDMQPPPPRWWRRRRPSHRLCISLRAIDAWRPQVELDGRVVDFPVRGGR